jgi:hypothetical protein
VTAAPRKRLGEMLLEAGVIDAAQLQAALGHQRRWGGRLGQALVDLKVATEAQIVDTLSRKLGYEPVHIASVEYGPALELALRLVPHAFAERHLLLPFSADSSTISVAMSDPTNMGVVDELAFRTGRRVKVSIAGDREIAAAVKRLYLAEKRHMEAISIDEEDEGPVEMLGPLDGGYAQPLDAFFSRQAAPGPSPASPQPPPLPAPAVLRPEARLAEAVRGLKLEDEHTGARTMGRPPAAAPTPPAEPLRPFVDLPPPPAAGELGSPRLQVILDDFERAAHADGVPPEVSRLARASGALLRVLLRKGLVTEQELVDELLRR